MSSRKGKGKVRDPGEREYKKALTAEDKKIFKDFLTEAENRLDNFTSVMADVEFTTENKKMLEKLKKKLEKALINIEKVERASPGSDTVISLVNSIDLSLNLEIEQFRAEFLTSTEEKRNLLQERYLNVELSKQINSIMGSEPNKQAALNSFLEGYHVQNHGAAFLESVTVCSNALGRNVGFIEAFPYRQTDELRVMNFRGLNSVLTVFVGKKQTIQEANVSLVGKIRHDYGVWKSSYTITSDDRYKFNLRFSFYLGFWILWLKRIPAYSASVALAVMAAIDQREEIARSIGKQLISNQRFMLAVGMGAIVFILHVAAKRAYRDNDAFKNFIDRNYDSVRLNTLATMFWLDLGCTIFFSFEKVARKYFGLQEIYRANAASHNILWYQSFFGAFRKTRHFSEYEAALIEYEKKKKQGIAGAIATEAVEVINSVAGSVANVWNSLKEFYSGKPESKPESEPPQKPESVARPTEPVLLLMKCIYENLTDYNPITKTYGPGTMGISNEYLERLSADSIPQLGRIGMCARDAYSMWTSWKPWRKKRGNLPSVEELDSRVSPSAVSGSYSGLFGGESYYTNIDYTDESVERVFHAAAGPSCTEIPGEPDPETEYKAFTMPMTNKFIYREVFIASVYMPPESEYQYRFKERTIVVSSDLSTLFEMDVSSQSRLSKTFYVEEQSVSLATSPTIIALKFTLPPEFRALPGCKSFYPIDESKSGLFVLTRLMLTHAAVPPPSFVPPDRRIHDKFADKLEEILEPQKDSISKMQEHEKRALFFIIAPQITSERLVAALVSRGKTDISE